MLGISGSRQRHRQRHCSLRRSRSEVRLDNGADESEELFNFLKSLGFGFFSAFELGIELAALCLNVGAPVFEECLIFEFRHQHSALSRQNSADFENGTVGNVLRDNLVNDLSRADLLPLILAPMLKNIRRLIAEPIDINTWVLKPDVLDLVSKPFGCLQPRKSLMDLYFAIVSPSCEK
jgi:hypothetical protein